MPHRTPLAPASLRALSDAILQAAEAARVGLAVTLVDGEAPRNVYVNEAFCAMLGYSQDEMLERPPFMNVPPDELPQLIERFRDRTTGQQGHISYELSLLAKDGSRVPCQITVGSTTVENRRATIAFIFDISEQRRAEQAARKSEQTFRQAIEIAPDAIGILREEGFVYANPAYARMLGYDSPDDLLKIHIDAIIHPEDLPTLRSRGKHLFGGGAALPPHVMRLRRRDGSYTRAEISSVPFEYEGHLAMLGVARDVTERNRLETQLVQADRLAALGTLAAGVAHEVNNPLAYLLLNLEWIARKLPEVAGDASKVNELAAMIEEARHGAERVGAIVRELRAFSRADGETRRHVDLRSAAASAIKIASHEIRHRARVVTDFDEGVPPVWANEARLEQVLLNLLLNAAQAMSETNPEKNEIRITVRGDGPTRAVLEVIDNGVGIPPETMRRIFDPFFTTKPVGVGTGLGLSICHSIITSLGGKISVSSQLGEGTTFRIVLPTQPSVGSMRELESEPPSMSGRAARRGRVLVVDDEVTIGNTMRDLLAPVHDVTAVSSGEAALAAIAKDGAFDVIFCDLMMPRVSGMDLYDRLRAEHRGLDERIVFMTGGAFTARAAEFLARVRNRRIEKPFALTEIERIVREMVELGSPAANRGVA